MTAPRPRGGQSGNTNAVKHGFYTHRINKRDLSLDEATLKNLAEEIACIRIFTRRVIEAVDPSADLNSLVAALRTICLASATITRLLKIQLLLAKDRSDARRILEEVIGKVNLEMGLSMSDSDKVASEVLESITSRPETSKPCSPVPNGFQSEDNHE